MNGTSIIRVSQQLLLIVSLAAALLTSFSGIVGQKDKAIRPNEIRDVGQGNSKGIEIEAALVDVLLRLQTPGGALLIEDCKGKANGGFDLLEAGYWLQRWIKRSLHPKQNIGGGHGGASSQTDFNNPTITVSVTDASVRKILNNIIVAQGNCLWVVHLNLSQLMEGERFYAQELSSTGKGVSDFIWEFVPLKYK
jgi:hypothetical protein